MAGKKRTRRFQFSMLTLLLVMTFVGPLLGLYGPAVYLRIANLLAPEPEPAVPSPVWTQARIRLGVRRQVITGQLKIIQARIDELEAMKAGQELDASGPWQDVDLDESIERGMQADAWLRTQSAAH